MTRRYYIDSQLDICALFSTPVDAEDDLVYAFNTREVVGNARLRKGFLVVAMIPSAVWPSGIYATLKEAKLHMLKLRRLMIVGEAWIHADFQLDKLHRKQDLVRIDHVKWHYRQ